MISCEYWLEDLGVMLWALGLARTMILNNAITCNQSKQATIKPNQQADKGKKGLNAPQPPSAATKKRPRGATKSPDPRPVSSKKRRSPTVVVPTKKPPPPRPSKPLGRPKPAISAPESPPRQIQHVLLLPLPPQHSKPAPGK